VPDSPVLQEFLLGLEYLLPPVMAAKHRWWQYEGLDGILPAVTRKVGPLEIEVIGPRILISDQSLAPVYVHLCVSSEKDEIECSS
jgi:hypothetical protein